MDDQHRKISGYRELSQTEIDLMNRIKALGPQIELVWNDVQLFLNEQARTTFDSAEDEAAHKLRLRDAQPGRWAAEGRTDLQKGLMSLTRAVAQPTFF